MSDGAGKYRRLLSSAIENVSNAFYDAYVEVNCRFRAAVGLKVTVIRDEIGDCCSWCKDLAGIYNYETVPKEVWGRHENCRCIVTTRTEKGTYQDAWSRIEFSNYRSNRIEREREILAEQRAIELEKKNGRILDTGWGKGYTSPPDNVKELMKRYDQAVEEGLITPFAGFDYYLRQYIRIENEIVGRKTVNGITITGQSVHFMERVLGTINKDNEVKERRGVTVDEIKDALFHGKTVFAKTDTKTGLRSQEFFGTKAEVTVNPDTGNLIQCNRKRKK